jgi:uncharacterized phage protein gp47/JayE
MAFDRPTLSEIVERVEQDFVSRLSLAGAVLRRSVIGVLSRVVAGAAHLLHGNLEFLSRQLFPDQSELEYLERQGSLYGIARKAAEFATGDLTFTGTNGTIIPAGTELQRSDGLRYETLADGTIASGTATITVDAQTAGDTGNSNAGLVLTLVSPIIGVNSSATVAAGGLTQGVDQEDDDQLRARIIERIQFAPHAGTERDYEAWAKEVSGVTRAWAFGGEMGLGTVTVRFVRDNDTPIVPDAGEVTAVQDYIDERRPITAEVLVVAPTAVVLNFTIEVTPDTAEVRAAVEAELRDLLTRDEVVPGGTVLLSQIRTAIGIAAGVTDYDLTAPAADVTHTVGQLPTMGAITWL